MAPIGPTAASRDPANTAASSLTTQCCIAGGGPAGMMLGFLLARAGVDVVVLEKHGDFLRDFRGDTIHPSTLELMRELGLLDEFLKRPSDRSLLGTLSAHFERAIQQLRVDRKIGRHVWSSTHNLTH